MMRRVLAVVALLALTALAGCTTFFELGGVPEPDSNHPDPDEDVIGWENGYWWNDSVAVDASDGLSKAEIEVVTARMMARIEHIRGHEFTEDVDVQVISREEYRSGGGGDRNGSPAEEQFWEATFVVGEDEGVGESFEALYGSSVQGYYTSGRIVVVSDGGDGDLHVSRATLVHELEHALQDQQLTLRVAASTRDGTLAGRGIIEGDANYVESLYERRCENDTWDCVTVPEKYDGDGGGGNGPPYNRGLFVSTFLPYAEGPTFVASLRERGGWDAVDAAFKNQPESTEQVIHPDAYPDERPERVVVPDRSNDHWVRVGDPQRVGEATTYATFWYNDQIPSAHYTSNPGNASRYTYDHPITAGWGGDSLVAYGNDDRYGYVWKTTWDSRADATEFAAAYRDLLDAHGATARDDGVYVVPNGGFADAFRVVQRDDTVLVVNAPTVDALDGVHERKNETDATEATAGPVTATVVAVA